MGFTLDIHRADDGIKWFENQEEKLTVKLDCGADGVRSAALAAHEHYGGGTFIVREPDGTPYYALRASFVESEADVQRLLP